jgi:hypothetical protein
MPYAIPSTQELAGRNLAGIESALGIQSPIAARAFNRAWAAVEGMADSGLYAYAADRARENLAMSASEEGLETIGAEYDIPRREAAPWRGKALFSLPHNQTLYLGTTFIGPQGIKYQTVETVTGSDDNTAILSLVCMEAGPSGNLSVSDTIGAQSVIDGAGRTATVTAVSVLGQEIENAEDYRIRVLDIIRGGSGGAGSNAGDGAAGTNVPACVTASDYRIVAEAVGGVARAYPFSGPPTGSGVTSVPGQRVVYIECQRDIDPDGIPPQSLLDLVRDAIKTDHVSGASREILGVPTGTDLLFVEPIERADIYVTVRGLSIPGSSQAMAETQIAAAVEKLLAGFAPFVQGLDADFDRRDELTNSVLSQEIQNVLDAHGGTAEGVIFSDQPSGDMGRLALANNEKLRLAGIVFEEAQA